MFRALFSVAIVLLLSTIALLLYANYVHEEKPGMINDLAAKTLPPPAPKVEPAPLPAPPMPLIEPLPPRERDISRRDPPKPKRPEAAPGQRTYVVEPGDSLWNISLKSYGTGDYTGKIAEANHIAAKDRIRPGQVLLLPDLPKHESKPESLSSVAEGPTAVEGSETKTPPAEPQNDPDPVTTTNRTEAPAEDSEIQPPLLNMKAPRP